MQATRKLGENDLIKDDRQEAKKYGIKRRFYDYLPIIERQLPKAMYV